MLNSLVDFLADPKNTNLVQVLSSVILVIITTVYAYLTYIISSSQYNSYIRPIKINVGKGDVKWVISVKNFGPNIAKNVKIRSMVVTSIKQYKMNGKIFIKKKSLEGNGPEEIEPGVTADYFFNYLIDFKYPIILKWKTIQNKKRCNKWRLIDNEGQDKINAVTYFYLLRVYVNLIILNIKLTFFMIEELYYNYLNKEKK